MKLKLGYAAVQVRVLPREQLTPDSDGDHSGGSVRLADDLSPIEEVRVLLHELGHEVCQRRGLGLPLELEERVVEAFAQDLTELLVRNPRLWAWLGERLGRA